MFEAFLKACSEAGIKPPKIMQTIGNAKASAGYHARDGLFNGRPYCCAVDLSVRSFFGATGYNEKQIKWLLWHLARNGFVGWYRYRGSFQFNRHLHIVYVGHPMKAQLRAQVFSFLDDRNGLAGNAKEPFWTAPADCDAELRQMFLKSNRGLR